MLPTIGFLGASTAATDSQYIANTGREIGTIEKRIHAWRCSCEDSRRLEAILGVGPIVATVLAARIVAGYV
jgi:hypothetical protein